ncbi:hypothetical protein Q1695_012664 [Nippostrongylus brasiliensis]|nr:hypothetical protein Q1695_012664 [Nippostrongylus brasiliensis]
MSIQKPSEESEDLATQLRTAEQSSVHIVETYDELMKNRISGDMPDDDLFCHPRWLVFRSPNQYKKPCYGEFSITNRNPYSVAWCLKAKEKMIRVSQCHGILKGGEELYITLYLLSSDDWPREVCEYTWRRHKIAVESLKIPDYIRPKNEFEATRISREIFQYSAMYNPLQRMYSKISILLE